MSAFYLAATMAGNKTFIPLKTAVKGLISHVFLARALVLKKKYMKRYLRKPISVITQVFMSRLVKINICLNEFSFFGNNQSLPMDEVLEIGTFALPAK